MVYNKKASIEVSISSLVVIIFGIVILITGILFVLDIMNILPETIKESSAPPLAYAEAIPEKSVLGTIFKIKAIIFEEEKSLSSSLKASISGEDFFVYDDGLHGDELAGDKIYAGVWDSSKAKNYGKTNGKVFFEDKSLIFNIELTDTACESIMINGNPDDKIDILFIGQDYEDTAALKKRVLEYADLNGENNGLFSYTPFREQKERFNIYLINRTYTGEDFGCEIGCKGVNSLVCCDDRKVNRISAECPADYLVILLNNEKFCGSASSYAKVCTEGSSNMPEVLVHEFGHIFGKLGDEYDYNIYADAFKLTKYNSPNCVDDCEKWPSGVQAGCFAGCGYSNLYRSAEKNSIMYTYAPVFNPVSIYYLNKILEKYSVFSDEKYELPAPLKESKKYLFELVYSNGNLSLDEIFIVPGFSPDRKATEEGYDAKVISFDGSILYSSKFYVTQTIFPFSDKESITEEEIDYTLSIPYKENAKKIEIYDNETKLLEFNVGYFSENFIFNETTEKPAPPEGEFKVTPFGALVILVFFIILFILYLMYIKKKRFES